MCVNYRWLGDNDCVPCLTVVDLHTRFGPVKIACKIQTVRSTPHDDVRCVSSAAVTCMKPYLKPAHIISQPVAKQCMRAAVGWTRAEAEIRSVQLLVSPVQLPRLPQAQKDRSGETRSRSLDQSSENGSGFNIRKASWLRIQKSQTSEKVYKIIHVEAQRALHRTQS